MSVRPDNRIFFAFRRIAIYVFYNLFKPQKATYYLTSPRAMINVWLSLIIDVFIVAITIIIAKCKQSVHEK